MGRRIRNFGIRLPRAAATLAARAITVLAFGAASDPIRAATVQLAPDRDATLYESATGSLANGAGTRLFSGLTLQNDDQDARRALLHFDLTAGIPPGATIIAVTLTLQLSRANDVADRDVSLYRVFADWGEGTSIAGGDEGGGTTATAGDATWLHRFFPTELWSQAGGDFAVDASATAAVGIENQGYDWSGAGLVADVQSWLDQPSTNFGWVLIGDESTPASARRFDSRENTVAVQRPVLTVTFTPPPTSGACCVASGACGFSTPLDCGTLGGSFQGLGTSCTPNPCPQPTGACCAGDGSCQTETADGCGASGGSYLGDGESCSATSCKELSGACCLPSASDGSQTGHCQEKNPIQCAKKGGRFLGDATACGIDLCPFVDPLPIPPVATPVSGSPGAAAHYSIPIVETAKQLHRDLAAPTRVWTYAGSYPGPTIEAAVDQPVEVDWTNDLRDESGQLRTSHLLPVDSCIHGAETDAARVVSHLHGAHTSAASDGYPESTLLPGQSALYTYPNHQLPATLWYHDHALGITRLNVYLGLAGFYLLRDPIEAKLGLPSGEFELPMAIQDRSFLPDGSLDYPALWDEHFFGDEILVNGKVWPYLDVQRGKYRFRVLNAANARTIRLSLSDGATFQQIGTDGGLLPAPVPLQSVTLSPAERADLVIDFAPYPPGTVLRLVNDAPAPFPGAPGVGVVPDVLEFRVGSETGFTAPLPAALRPLISLDEKDATVFRTFELRKYSEPCAGSMWMINGLEWEEVTERPVLGDTEIWSFVNRSNTTHPMHIHLNMFQILDRQPFGVVGDEVVPDGPTLPPAPNEAGWKDTVAVNPFEIVRVIVKFSDYAGLFPFHCHILEHEDHEMMRQFEALPREIFLDGFESGGTSAWSAAVP